MAEALPRTKLIDEVKLRLGHGIIDIELDPQHYTFAFERALMRYRQRSSHAMEESFLFLDLQPEQSTYTLPDEVQDVIGVLRRGTGQGGGGTAIDPFSLAFSNNIYMIQNPGNLGGTGSGFLATYDLAVGFQNLAGRLFGREVLYTWDPATKRLRLERLFTATEEVVIHVWNTRPESVLLCDPYSRLWLYDYTVAVCKQILGEARSKFGQIAGPQGGVTLNGDALKNEAKEEMERLDTELEKFVDQQTGWPFIIA